MKGKSWQRFALAVIMTVGYFGVIIMAYRRNDLETVKTMVQALPPMITAVTTAWIWQVGNEKKGGQNEQ